MTGTAYAQAGIAVFGAAAILLSQQRQESRRRWACLLGLASQPFWFWATWEAGQWVMFALCFFYTYSWLVGLRNHWVRR